MERYAWKATVKDGMLAEYRRRHDEIWDEMKEVLRAAGDPELFHLERGKRIVRLL